MHILPHILLNQFMQITKQDLRRMPGKDFDNSTKKVF